VINAPALHFEFSSSTDIIILNALNAEPHSAKLVIAITITKKIPIVRMIPATVLIVSNVELT